MDWLSLASPKEWLKLVWSWARRPKPEITFEYKLSRTEGIFDQPDVGEQTKVLERMQQRVTEVINSPARYLDAFEANASVYGSEPLLSSSYAEAAPNVARMRLYRS